MCDMDVLTGESMQLLLVLKSAMGEKVLYMGCLAHYLTLICVRASPVHRVMG